MTDSEALAKISAIMAAGVPQAEQDRAIKAIRRVLREHGKVTAPPRWTPSPPKRGLPGHAVTCPLCGAGPGMECVSPAGETVRMHRPRIVLSAVGAKSASACAVVERSLVERDAERLRRIRDNQARMLTERGGA